MMGECKITISFFREQNKIVMDFLYPECTERNILGRSKE